MVWFGAPIQPRKPSDPKFDRGVQDPPLQVDELSGLLTGWQKRADGWWGQVEYRFPVHGYGTMLRFIDWFPVNRLRLVE